MVNLDFSRSVVRTYIRQFVSVLPHSHHTKFLPTSGLSYTDNTSIAFSVIQLNTTVYFARLHRASHYFRLHILLIACRSIKDSVSRRYPIIPLFEIGLYSI